MKSIWKGSISFGLVNIPIEIYSAVQAHSLGFKLLHAKCHHPISYERWCQHCKQEVAWQDIVKGLKLEDESYFILTPENIKKLKPEKTDTIDVLEFIDVAALEPIYTDQHYYIMPTKENDKAYFLFIAALKDLNKIAIGQFVLRDKQYICALASYEKGLLLTTLNYEYEIRKSKKFAELKAPKIDSKELSLAEQLINKLYKKKFDMGKYKDQFVEQVEAKLKQKGKRAGVKPKASEKKVKLGKETLIETLRASLKPKATITRRAARA